MTQDRSGLGMITGAALITTVAAVAAGVLLSHLTRPPDFDARLAQVKTTIEQAQIASRTKGDADAYGPRAVCPGRSAADVGAIRAALVGAVARVGLPPPVLSLTVPHGGDDSPIAPIAISLQAEGRYDAVLNLLGLLEKLQPELFVDGLDVKAKAAAADLRLSGKVFCWTVAR
jgi:hypothetical protein